MKVFFDGACYLCSFEMKQYYRENLKQKKIEFVNIASEDFDEKAYSLQERPYNKYMHVQDEEGNIQTKVDAFRAIWRVLGYKKILFISNLFFVKPILSLFYEIFAFIRPFLPKKQYCEIL